MVVAWWWGCALPSLSLVSHYHLTLTACKWMVWVWVGRHGQMWEEKEQKQQHTAQLQSLEEGGRLTDAVSSQTSCYGGKAREREASLPPSLTICKKGLLESRLTVRRILMRRKRKEGRRRRRECRRLGGEAYAGQASIYICEEGREKKKAASIYLYSGRKEGRNILEEGKEWW